MAVVVPWEGTLWQAAKPASFLMKTRPSRLASRLLALPLAGWLGACIIPQDDNYLTEIPEQKNRAPRIVESQVQPSERIIKEYGTTVCNVEFSVAVEDPDVDDLLSVHWYVDYDPAQPRGAYEEDQLRSTTVPQREERAYLRLNANQSGNPLATPGDHIVEAVVTDTRLINRVPLPIDQKTEADGGVLINPGYAASYAWFVQTGQGGNCP